MADDRTNNIDVATLFDDVLKTSKSASQFGPVRVYRVPEKPADSFGRNGDLCIIDNTAVSSIEIAIEECPTDVGFCQKIYAQVPSGPNRGVSTTVGADLTGNDSFTINGTTITLPAGPVFPIDAADEINAASLPGMVAIGTATTAPGLVVDPSVLPGDQLIINGVTITFPLNGGISYIASVIDAAAIPFISTNILGSKLTLTHTRGGEIVLGGASLAQIMGAVVVAGGTLSIDNEDGTQVTLADVVGIPLATMGFPLIIPTTLPLVCGGTWQCFDSNGIEIKDHGTSLGTFETIDFTGTGVTITDGGGGEAIVDISGVVGTLDIFKNVFGDTGSVIASGPNSNLRIEGSGIITTSIVGDTLTIASTGAAAQNLVDTFTGDIGSFTASTPNDTLNILGTGTISTAMVGNTLTISSTGAGAQNLWLTVQDDVAGTISASSTTDTLIVAGGTGISTAVAGSTLTITNTAPNVDQNLVDKFISDSGTFTASAPADTLSIVGGGVISTSVVGSVLTISSSGAAAQNLYETFTGNTGSRTATTPTDTLNIVGTGIVSTALVGNTLTISSSGGADQNLWETVSSDSGSAVANTPTDTLTISGGTGISTAISGDTLTITNDSPNVDQNLVDKFVSDSGTFTAAVPADTLNIVGAGTVSTAVSGDTLTITGTGGVQNVWLTVQDDAAATISASSATDTITVAGAGGITTSVSGSTLTITSNGGQIATDTKEPTGFVNRTDSVISFSDAAPRQFTISVLGPATQYQYYIHGVIYTETTTKTLTIPNVDGIHFIYFDNTQTLQTTQVFSDTLLLDNALAAAVYWNSANNTSTYFGDERHGIIMDGETHLHLHLSLGCQYVTGLLVDGTLNPDAASPTDADVQTDVSTGTIRDEDLSHDIVDNGGKVNVYDLEQNISPIAQIPVMYRLGVSGLWYIKPADNFPFIYSGDGSGYVGATNGLPPYNQLSGGSWQLTEVGNNTFFLVHIFATNDIRNPIIAIQGIDTYTNKPAGRDAAEIELKQLTGLPFLEFTPLVTLIAEARTVYTNTPQIRFRTTDAGEDYVDWRNLTAFGSTGGGVTQNLYANLTDGTNIASAAIPNDTITFTAGTGISAVVSSNPDTLTITNTAPNPTGMTITTINGQPMLTLVDTTRTDKILSVAEQNLVFSENRLDNLDWIDIGAAVDADSGYIMDFDGTVVFATGHCENTNAFSKTIHLFINGVDQGSLGTLSGGANATFINTTIDLNFSQGDRIRLQAQDGISGFIEDTVVKVSVKWRG